jgi:hypothetical protein
MPTSTRERLSDCLIRFGAERALDRHELERRLATLPVDSRGHAQAMRVVRTAQLYETAVLWVGWRLRPRHFELRSCKDAAQRPCMLRRPRSGGPRRVAHVGWPTSGGQRRAAQSGGPVGRPSRAAHVGRPQRGHPPATVGTGRDAAAGQRSAYLRRRADLR